MLFYFTGSDYVNAGQGNGYYDVLDGAVELDTSTNSLPPPPSGEPSNVNFASLTINANSAIVTLTGLSDSSSPFNGLLFFQRRRNENALSIQGKAGDQVTLGGTVYAKWANFKLAGSGKYDAQFLVGSIAISGQAAVTINSTGKNRGKANQVFLVE